MNAVKPNRALVAGGSGFIGQFLTKALLKKNFLVRVFDINAGGIAEIKNANLELFIGNMLDGKAVNEAMKGIDVVYHLALADSFKDFESLLTNLKGTYNLLEAALHNKVKHFLFASSGVVYWAEESTIGGRWYPLTKLATEKLCMKYYHEYGLPVTALRLGAVYFDVGWFCESIASKALKGEKIKVLENEWCDYIHVDDVIEGFLTVTLKEKAHGEVFDVTNPNTSITELELAEIIIKALKSKSKINIVKEKPHRKAERLLKFKLTKTKKDLIEAINQYCNQLIEGKVTF